MLLAFHKPYGVLSQFTKEEPKHRTLAEFGFPKNVYSIGRLDWDSEGLLLLSDEKEWNDRLLNPSHEHPRTYHAQVEGVATEEAMARLRKGVMIQGQKTKPCSAKLLNEPSYPPRNPPIRFRLSVPTSWVEIQLTEGRNRQVRRMTAAVGFPTLRLIRVALGAFELDGLELGRWKELSLKEKRLLLAVAQETPPETATDNEHLTAPPMKHTGGGGKFTEALAKINERHGQTFRKLTG